MAQYRSFLVRWWDLQSGEQRIEIEQLQSGVRAVFATAAEVADWIAAQSTGTAPEEPEDGGASDPAAGGDMTGKEG